MLEVGGGRGIVGRMLARRSSLMLGLILCLPMPAFAVVGLASTDGQASGRQSVIDGIDSIRVWGPSGSVDWVDIVDLDGGDTVLVGTFTGTISLPATGQASAQSTDIVIARLGSSGIVWAKTIGATNSDYVYDVDANSTNLVIATEFHGSVSLPGLGLQNLQYPTGVILSYDLNGNAQDCAVMPLTNTSGDSEARITGVRIHPTFNSVIVMGEYSEVQADLGTDDLPVTGNDNTHGFVALTSRGLDWVWGFAFEGADVEMKDIDVPDSTKIAVGGTFTASAPIRYRGDAQNGRGGQDGFAAILTTIGGIDLLRTHKGDGTDSVNAVVIDSYGRLVVAGEHCIGATGACSVKFWEDTYSGTTGNDSLHLTVWNPGGTPDLVSLIHQPETSPGGQDIVSVSKAGQQHLIWSLNSMGPVSLIPDGQNPIELLGSPSDSDAHLIALDSGDHHFVWSNRSTGASEEIYDVEVGVDNTLHIGMSGVGSLMFGSESRAVGDSDAVVAIRTMIDWDLDGIHDGSDSCETSGTVFTSNASNDHDGDGCHDSSEDTDDDDDGRTDLDAGGSDACPIGLVGWNSSDVSVDRDADGCHDMNEDPDDDNDGVNDTVDNCMWGETGWISGPVTDNDEDGCRDESPEDLDDDNDGVLDCGDDGNCSTTFDNDRCSTGLSNWTSSSVNDIDGDGCKDDDVEDYDDDNDGLADASDDCDRDSGAPTSAQAWFTNVTDDWDRDGCRDSDEDDADDGDGVDDDDDLCDPESGHAESEKNWVQSDVNDHDWDGCKDNEDDDDDNDNVPDSSENLNDQDCSRGHSNWTSHSSNDYDSDGCHDSIEDTDDDNDGVADTLDACATGSLSWPSNGNDIDGDGCLDGVEDDDLDNDLVPDDIDECENTTADMTPNEVGCALEQLDGDNDGVSDDRDACPNTFFGSIVDTSDGCSSTDLDADGDDVRDDLEPEECLNTEYRFVKEDSVDSHGCPQDDDGDGVPNLDDACANTPSGVNLTEDGCIVVITSTAVQGESDSDEDSLTIVFLAGGVVLFLAFAIVVYVLVLRGEDDFEGLDLDDEYEDEPSYSQGAQDAPPPGPQGSHSMAGPQGGHHPMAVPFGGQGQMRGAPPSTPSPMPVFSGPPPSANGVRQPDGYEYVEWPNNSGTWYLRAQPTEPWKKWE